MGRAGRRKATRCSKRQEAGEHEVGSRWAKLVQAQADQAQAVQADQAQAVQAVQAHPPGTQPASQSPAPTWTELKRWERPQLSVA